MMMGYNTLFKLAAFFILVVNFACSPGTKYDSTIPLYIGTYTSEGSEGIYMARFDTINGALIQPVLAAQLHNPSYLTLTPCKSYLFAVSEGDGSAANLFSYRVEAGSGLLTLADSVATGGAGSCYVSLVGCGRLAIANYSSGDVSFISFNEDGVFPDEPVTFQHKGSGPDASRQDKPHAHSVMADKKLKYVYAADLGSDKLFVFQCLNDTVITVSAVPVAPGSGPRHFDFHPSGKMMALLNELTHTVDVFVPDSQGIFSIKIQTVALLPDSLVKNNYSADIHFSADGNYLYASVRGVDRIEIFSVNIENSTLQRIDVVDEGINWPRNFTLDPTGRFLLVANQKGNDVVVFRRDAETGILTPTENSIEVSMPVCLKF